MNDHPHSHDEHERGRPNPAETPVDAGSQALAEALRSSFAIIKVVMVLLVIAFLASGFFQVGPQERAIVLRFGKPVGTGANALLGPGLHWSLPYPIDEYQKVSVTGLQQVRSTACWYATTDVQEAAGTEPPPGPSLNPAVDGYAISADNNIIHTRAWLYYRIEDPVTYVFGFTNVTRLIQDTLNTTLLATAAQFKVDDILTRNVSGFQDAVTRRVTQLLEKENLGIVVDHCTVQSIPPRYLKTAFDNVLRAEITRSKVLNDAKSYAFQVTSKAMADSRSITNDAETARARYVKEVNSHAANFEKILESPGYKENPQLFVQERLNDTLSALTNAEKWVLPPVNGKSQEVRLLLNRLPPEPKTAETTTP
ncbi:MAG TPA: protease modulator HflK [Verrucomicrobiae bacterium]|nr:protease modulator HflK [Verrucomicrobiae bacterium]